MSTLTASIQYCPGDSRSKIVGKDNEKERKKEGGRWEEREQGDLYGKRSKNIFIANDIVVYIENLMESIKQLLEFIKMFSGVTRNKISLQKANCTFVYQQGGASQVALVVKNPPANAGDVKDVGSISGSGRFPGGGHGYPLQYACLENPMHRGAWQATVHRVAKS